MFFGSSFGCSCGVSARAGSKFSFDTEFDRVLILVKSRLSFLPVSIPVSLLFDDDSINLFSLISSNIRLALLISFFISLLIGLFFFFGAILNTFSTLASFIVSFLWSSGDCDLADSLRVDFVLADFRLGFGVSDIAGTTT